MDLHCKWLMPLGDRQQRESDCNLVPGKLKRAVLSLSSNIKLASLLPTALQKFVFSCLYFSSSVLMWQAVTGVPSPIHRFPKLCPHPSSLSSGYDLSNENEAGKHAK